MGVRLFVDVAREVVVGFGIGSNSYLAECTSDGKMGKLGGGE